MFAEQDWISRHDQICCMWLLNLHHMEIMSGETTHLHREDADTTDQIHLNDRRQQQHLKMVRCIFPGAVMSLSVLLDLVIIKISHRSHKSVCFLCINIRLKRVSSGWIVFISFLLLIFWYHNVTVTVGNDITSTQTYSRMKERKIKQTDVRSDLHGYETQMPNFSLQLILQVVRGTLEARRS